MRARRVVGWVCSVFGVLVLALVGVVLLGIVPAERVLGPVKLAVDQGVAAVTQQPPTIRLGELGGEHELDTAGDREFIELESYRAEGIPPVFAAHNNRGGDIILGWSPGDHVHVVDRDGVERVYEVGEERITRKWDDIETLVGMSGTIVVQTCFYGVDEMRFLGLNPVP